MDNNVTLFMEMALEVVITTIIIGAILSIANLANQSMAIYQKDVDTNYQMELYDKYSMYDDTIVSGADAISSVFLYASPDFTIQIGSNSYNNPSVNIADLEAFIDPTGDYSASLIFDKDAFGNSNGAIIGLKFY